MIDIATKLLTEIRSAFPEDPVPEERVVGHSCLECDSIAEFLQGKRWADVDARTLFDRFSSALSMITPSAFQYYLPAFLSSGLSVPPDEDPLVDSLGVPDQASRAFWCLRIGHLSRAQQEVLAAYLRLRLQSEIWPDPARDALDLVESQMTQETRPPRPSSPRKPHQG